MSEFSKRDSRAINRYNLVVDEILSHERALSRIAVRGLKIQTIIDVGASDGSWSVMAKNFWPWAQCHLIEAYPYWRDALEELTTTVPGFSYTLAAAGKQKGITYFSVRGDDPYSGASQMANTKGAFQVDQVSLDDEVESRPLIGPFLIKLDTHGADLDILAGANRTLKETKLIVAEVYNFQSSEKRFPKFCIHLEELGFRCVDIAAPLFRPRDGAFYQFDILFVREGDAAFMNDAFF